MAKRKRSDKSGSKPAARPVAVDTTEAKVVSQPSVRTSILWTPAHLVSLALQVDSGDMSRLAELVDQMVADDKIGELLSTLAEEVLGAKLTFEKDARSTVGNAVLSPELEDDWAYGYDDDELTQLSIWTQVAGVGFAKHEIWVESEDGRIVPQLKWWHLKHFKYETNSFAPNKERTWLVRDENGQYTPIRAGDGKWLIATRRGEYRPWANGLWRPLSPWWMLKRYAISDWGVHSEKASKLVATSDNETTAELRKSLAQYVYQAAKDAVIALPPGFDLKLIELEADTEAIYNAQIKAADAAITITCLGQNLSSNVEGGSRAAAEVHERKENKKARWLAKMLAKCLQPQSLTWWAEFNFGDRTLAPYPRWHTEPDEDWKAKADGLKALGDALTSIKTAGYKLSVETIEDEYGVALEEAPPPEPEPVQPQPGKPGAPQPGNKPPKALGRVVLASGDDPAAVPGYVAGQVYVDALTDKQTSLGADYLRAFIDRIAAAIEGAEDYEAVRVAVLNTFAEEEDPERLVELVEHGMLLANLAGRHAVAEDAES